MAAAEGPRRRSVTAPLPSTVGAPGAEHATSRVRRGLRSSLAAQGLMQVSSVVATIVLARLLDPKDFGIVALSQSILGVAALVSLAGVSAALITRRDDVTGAATTLFWMAGLAGCTVLVLALGLAPLLTATLGDGRASPYVIVLAVSFAIDVVALV